jgi:hypothetical protein
MKATIVVMFCLLVLCISISRAYGNEPESKPPVALKVVDVVIVRPISAAVAAATTVVCIGTMPIAFVAGVSEHSARILIEAPWRFTGARRLGEFDRYRDGNPITVIPD